MVDLRRLRCTNPQCPESGQLEAAGGTQLRCASCGAEDHVNTVIKPYATATGQWFIGAAAAFGVGYSRFEGQLRWGLLALAGTVLAYALYRVWWQARVLRALK